MKITIELTEKEFSELFSKISVLRTLDNEEMSKIVDATMHRIVQGFEDWFEQKS